MKEKDNILDNMDIGDKIMPFDDQNSSRNGIDESTDQMLDETRLGSERELISNERQQREEVKQEEDLVENILNNLENFNEGSDIEF